MFRRRCDIRTIAFVICCLGLLWLGHSRMLRDPGTYWHIAAGEKMLSDRAIIQADPFSYSMHAQPWIAQQWLAECLMALLHRIAGLDLVLLAFVGLIAALFAALAGRLHRAGCPPITLVFICMLVFGASSFHFLARPHLATVALLALLQILLCDVESGRRTPYTLLAVPAIMLLWTNLHGGALGGLVVVALVISIWIAAPHVPVVRRYVAEPAATPLLGAVLVLSTLAILVNPYGPRLPAAWIALLRSPLLPQLIIEHAPLQFLSFEGLAIVTLGVIYLCLFARAVASEFRVAWIIPLLWLLLALTRVRHGPLFAVTAGFCIADMLPFVKISPLIRAPARLLDPPISARAAWHIPALLLILIATLQVSGIRLPLVGAGWATIPPEAGSQAALLALRRELQTSPSDRVFNEMRYGGLLIYQVPTARLYIDDRCELYGDHGLRRYVELCTNPGLFCGQAAYDDLHLALVSHGGRLDRHLAQQPGWRRVHADPLASLYRRAD